MESPCRLAILLAGLAVGTMAFAGGGHAAKAACGRVAVADMNWSSATLLAHVDAFILAHGYGCDVEFVPGDTMPTGTSMIEKGQPDVASELWTNAIEAPLARGVAEGRLAIAGDALSDGGREGFWVPKYMVDEVPALATIAGIKANAHLFAHPEDPSKSAFYGCPAGWTCQVTTGNLFRALGLADAGFALVDPGSAAGLDGALARANERGMAWFGYYWAPTAMLGKYAMVQVDFGTGVDEAHFKSCIAQAGCAAPMPTMYPSSPVRTVTTAAFAAAAPEAFAYLGRRSFTNEQMNAFLVWMEDNQADGEIVADHFLRNYEHLWTDWMPESVAAKVKAAIR